MKKKKAFIDYLQTIDKVYENEEDYNPSKEKKVLVVFDGLIVDMVANKN